MTTEPCAPGRCRRLGDGHVTHPIRARRAGETPWGWRDGVVTAAGGGEASVRYVGDDAEPSLWHHADLPVAVGAPVRLHEEFRILDTGTGWHCVTVTGGAGPAPAPAHPQLSAAATSFAIVDLATGDARSASERRNSL